MRILVTGANGQVGRALRREFAQHEVQATFVTRDELDISNPASVGAFDWSRFDVVINAAAYTNVDGAETPGGWDAAWATNVTGTAYLASAAIHHDLTLVTFSSDYIFSGLKSGHYSENDTPNPVNSYGDTKLAGDLAARRAPKHYIFRTSWVYFPQGRNFVEAILRKAQSESVLSVVADQRGRPTYAGDIARAVRMGLERELPYGVYNCQGSGEPVTWLGFARGILEQAGVEVGLEPVTSAKWAEERPGSAKRPANGLLSTNKLRWEGVTLPPWKESLAEAMPLILNPALMLER